MQQPIDRRSFLRRSLGAAAGLGVLATACREPSAEPTPTAGAPPAGDAGALFRISLAQWSFHRALRGREMDNLEFAPEAAAMGFGAVEYVNQFFKDRANDAEYLARMNRAADDAGVANLLIMCDGEGRLGDPDEARRIRAVDNHRRWLDAASALGCHSIRVNAASDGTPDEQRQLAADGLRRLTEIAAGQDLSVLVENHGGLSSNGAWLASVMRAVDHPRCGTLPDFGNFRIAAGEDYDRYRGVEELMPFAKAVSAKSHEFDEGGNEVHTDYRRMMRIVLDAGYRGWVGIEYEGSALPEREGILATKRLLERVRDELS